MKYSMGVFFIIVLITLLTTIIAVFPAGIFWLAFKASSLISEKRYIPAVAIIIFTLNKDARFIKISNAGLRESHPHDVENIKAAPNYEK